MITPERALELAIWLDPARYEHKSVKLHPPAIGQISAILRHYAEIMQADPVAEVCDPKAFVSINWENIPATVCQPFRDDGTRVVRVLDNVPAGSALIIKPKPL